MENGIVQEQDVLGDFDLDYLFQEIPEVSDLFENNMDPCLSSDPSIQYPSPGESNSPASNSSWVNVVEQFLLEDEGEVREEDDLGFHEDFFSDVFLDGSDSGKCEVTTPEADSEEKEDREGSVVRVGEDEDPITKKQRRQMRNRDSAMQSRERKKMYVKDLEMKSKYLESECRRLDRALQCCLAENVALRHQLQKDRAFGAPAAKQESAVLVMESLLLGSLFWLVSIVCLFLMPDLLGPNQKDASRLGRGLAQEVVGVERLAIKRFGSDLGREFIFMKRRCRGMRTKMKCCVFPLHAVFVW